MYTHKNIKDMHIKILPTLNWRRYVSKHHQTIRITKQYQTIRITKHYQTIHH
jgi:hypothetical protein